MFATIKNYIIFNLDKVYPYVLYLTRDNPNIRYLYLYLDDFRKNYLDTFYLSACLINTAPNYITKIEYMLTI